MSHGIKREIANYDKNRTQKINFLLEFFDDVIIILERDWEGLPEELLVVNKLNKIKNFLFIVEIQCKYLRDYFNE